MNTQQRRSFFQTTTSANATTGRYRRVESRFLPWGRIAVMCAALLFSGCASLTPERVQVLAAIAGQAAQVGAMLWLQQHPEHKPSFDAVIVALAALQRAGNTNEAAFTELISSLPTGTLRGPDGELYVSEGLVVWDAKLEKAVAVEGAAVVPVQRATLAGLKRAVMPPAPVPTRRGLATNDAALDAEFQRYLKEKAK